MKTIAENKEVSRRTAFEMLKNGDIEFFITPRSGQISTVARQVGIGYTSRKIGDNNLVRIERGEQARRPAGLNSATANPVAVLSPGEKEDLRRLLTKLLVALEE